MQHGRVVELGEGVDVELPVAVHVGPVLVDLRHLPERVPLETLCQLAEVVAQRRGVGRVEVDEDEPFPGVDPDGREAVVGLVEIEELALLLHEGEVTLEGVAPTVVLALELPARPRHLFARVVLPDELVPAVSAHVVEGAHLLIG